MQYLHDYEFLKKLDQQRSKTLYIQIEVLSKEENSLAIIDGICTGGNISLNAKSSMRRQGSLTMIANSDNKNLMNVNNLISINKRIAIAIGLKNETALYQEQKIIWFPMGVFVITSATVSKNQQGVNINIQFKDKMALLDGSIGGTFASPITHSPIYVEDATAETGFHKEGISFYNLIYTLVAEFGNIPAHNIMIDDIDLRVKNTMRYTGDTPIWVYPTTIDNNIVAWTITTTEPVEGNDSYCFNKGDNIGYQYTDFIYPLDQDFTSQAGETIESVLKKITQQLNNYEYFFDVDGNFHFQEIKNGLNQGSSKENLIDALGDKYFASLQADKATYVFENDALFTTLAVNPQYPNVKNAFIVWGEKKGTKTIIRYHLIIDTPPSLSYEKVYSFYTRNEAYFINGERKEYTRGYRAQEGKNDRDAATVTLGPNDDWRIILYYELLTGARQAPYAKEYIEEFPKQYDIINKKYLVPEEDFVYYLDMIDPLQVEHPIVSQLGVSNIGYRLSSENKKEVNSILSGVKTPNVILLNAQAENVDDQINEALANFQLYTFMPAEVANHLEMGTTLYSAYDYTRAKIHNSLSYADTVQISCIPIYYLEPGQRISLNDYDTGVQGDYIIQTMSIPLTVDGVMSISATRAIERI